MNRQQMTAPFAEEELRQFEGRGGKTMTYIQDETVMDRLDAGYGFGNWQVQVDPVGESVVKVRLGVRGESHEWVWYEDFGYPNREGGETLKEAVSDGIRRCGRMVGIARDLYRKSSYEPGGSLAAVAKPDKMEITTGETLRSLGGIERSGAIAKGSGRHSDLEWRQTPDGYQIGFLLEVGDGKAKPQVSIAGTLAVAVFAALGNAPMLGMAVTVRGELLEVTAPQRRKFYRIVADYIETPEWTVPAKVEAETEPLGLVEDDLSDLPDDWKDRESQYGEQDHERMPT